MTEQPLIGETLASGKPIFSVEFFPPKDDAAGERMLRTAERLKPHDPDFVSITYGAGGGTRATTLKYALLLREKYGFEVMPHLTCVGHTREELLQILNDFDAAGFRNVMALRGDPPKGEDQFMVTEGGFSHADQLVKLIRENFPEFGIGVAGYPEKHPEAPDFEVDVRHRFLRRGSRAQDQHVAGHRVSPSVSGRGPYQCRAGPFRGPTSTRRTASAGIDTTRLRIFGNLCHIEKLMCILISDGWLRVRGGAGEVFVADVIYARWTSISCTNLWKESSASER